MAKRTVEEIQKIVKKLKAKQQELDDAESEKQKHIDDCISVGICPECGEKLTETRDESWDTIVICKPCNFRDVLDSWDADNTDIQ